jgi:HK97 family phage portal protein
MDVKEQITAPERIHPFGSANRMAPRLSPQQLRRWADTSEWVRAAINHRRAQCSQAMWHITPVDPAQSYDPQLAAMLEMLFLHPNTRQRGFRELIEPMIEDILVLDAGVIEKELNLKGVAVALHLVDGATMRMIPNWDGDVNKPRYAWVPRGTPVATLLDSQVIYLMANPTSHRLTGFSPLEALKIAIDSDLEAALYNKRLVGQVNPPGILNLGENVGAPQADSFRVYWDSEVAGRKQMGIVAGVKNPQFINMGQTAKEMQFMQWQVYLLRKIAAVFGIAPQDLGITFDVNRANATVQQELSEDRGLRPLLSMIEEAFNTEIIADFTRTRAKQLHRDGKIDMPTLRMAIGLSYVNPRERAGVFQKLHEANILNLMFKFRLRSSKSHRDQADFNKAALGGVPWLSINEPRAEDGRDPVDGGDEIIVPTPIGPMPLSIISGQSAPKTEAQARYLERILDNAPIALRSGTTVEERIVEVPVPMPYEVDADGDPVDD